MRCAAGWAMVALVVGRGPALQGNEFRTLLLHVPPQANTLVMIDVDRTLEAKLAQQQGWSKKLEAAYVERPIFLPPDASRLVLAASLAPEQEFQRRWELAVMQLKQSMPMSMVARRLTVAPSAARSIASQMTLTSA